MTDCVPQNFVKWFCAARSTEVPDPRPPIQMKAILRARPSLNPRMTYSRTRTDLHRSSSVRCMVLRCCLVPPLFLVRLACLYKVCMSTCEYQTLIELHRRRSRARLVIRPRRRHSNDGDQFLVRSASLSGPPVRHATTFIRGLGFHSSIRSGRGCRTRRHSASGCIINSVRGSILNHRQ